MKLAKEILGDPYGGPSISYDKDTKQFLVYVWGDAPVSTGVGGRGKSITAALQDYKKRKGRLYDC